MWQAANGSRSVDSLIEPTDPALLAGSSVAPGAWSPDGHILVFVVHTSVANGADIWALHLGATRTVTPVIERPGDQWSVRVSPDGHWISYASNESGHFEVYVEPLAGGAQYQLSTDGGEQPIWSPRRLPKWFASTDCRETKRQWRWPTRAVWAGEQQRRLHSCVASCDERHTLLLAEANRRIHVNATVIPLEDILNRIPATIVKLKLGACSA